MSMLIVAALILWFVGGAVTAFVIDAVLARQRMPPRVSEDEFVRHAVEQDAKWRERMMQ